MGGQLTGGRRSRLRKERQQVGLLRDALDQIGDRRNLLDRGSKVAEFGISAGRLFRGIVGERKHVVRPARQVIDDADELVSRLRDRSD